MQESYRYGVAGQPGPESCAGSRKAAREALTGEHAGRVLSRESGRKSECRRCSNMRKATPANAKCEHPSGSARSKTPGMRGNFTRENREVPSTPDTQLCTGRLEKDVIQKSNMHVDGKSDGREVPTKCPNKSGNPLAEGAEGSRPTKENTEQTTASQTQSWGGAVCAKQQRGTSGYSSLRYFTTFPLHCWRAASTP